MSDRTNRDVGNKKALKKHKGSCTCWHCLDGKTKLREKIAKLLRKKAEL